LKSWKPLKSWKHWALGLGVALSVTLLLLGKLYLTAYQVVSERPELQYIKDCAPGGDSLVVHYTFDTVEGYRTPDLSGHANAGQLGSLFENSRLFLKFPHQLREFALPGRVAGRNGSALDFNGKNWVQGGNNRCYTTDQFTVAAWVWRDSTPAPKAGDYLVPTIAGKSNWPASGWWLCTKPNTNFLDMAISLGPKITHVHSGYEIPANEWHHIAVTVDKAADEIDFYVDGKLFGDKHTQVAKWLTNWDQNLFIGDYDGTARWPWFGRIGDFRYYRTRVNPEEIHAIYQGAGTKI
jgi:hypothetical protein